MPALLPLLSTLLTSIAGQIMLALGISFISYQGIDALQSQMVTLMQSEINRLPPDALQILYLGGFGVAMNWLMGGATFALSFTATAKIGSILKSKN